MTARDFCYWLQGSLELNGNNGYTPDQVELIRRHLNLVFIHDIDAPDPDGKLQAAHDGEKVPPHATGEAKMWKRPPGARC